MAALMQQDLFHRSREGDAMPRGGTGLLATLYLPRYGLSQDPQAVGGAGRTKRIFLALLVSLIEEGYSHKFRRACISPDARRAYSPWILPPWWAPVIQRQIKGLGSGRTY